MKTPFLMTGFLFYSFPLKEKTMKPTSFYSVAAAVFCILSCEPDPYFIKTRREAYFPARNDQELPETDTSEVIPPQSHIFISAVEFPDGYNWKTDREFGNVNCNLILFDNGKEVLSVPAGKGSEISSDLDMHRVADGHLFSEFTSPAETVIKMDGEECIRYKGREFLKGLLVKENKIYTLGQDKSGKGFSFRRNGTCLTSSKNGEVLGELFEDDGQICFVYSESSEGTEQGLKIQWYLFRDSESIPLDIPEDIHKIYDIRQFEGRILIAGSLNSLGLPVLYIDDNRYDLSENKTISTQYCHFREIGGSLFLTGNISRLNSGEESTAIWELQNMKSEIPYRDSYFFFDKNYIAYIAMDGKRLKIYSTLMGEKTIESGMLYFSDKCFLCKDKTLKILLNPATAEGKPALFDDGEITEYDFNGFFTSISSWP